MDSEPTTLHATAAHAENTPTSSHPLAGYIARAGKLSDGTISPLEANGLWLRSQGTRGVLILTLDVIGITPTLRKLCRGVSTEVFNDPPELLVNATHTHSAPATWSGTLYPGHVADVSIEAMSELRTRLIQLFTRLRDLPPRDVKASFRSVAIEGVGANRLDPGLSLESVAGVLELTDHANGTLVAALIDYACHPTVLGFENMKYSADWWGYARSALRQSLPDDPEVILMQGAAGDVSTRFTRNSQTLSEARRLGELFAEQVRSSRASVAISNVSPTFATGVLDVPTRTLPSRSEVEDEIEEATATLRTSESEGAPGSHRLAQTNLDGSKVLLALCESNIPDRIQMEYSRLVLGPIHWLFLPIEAFSTLATEISTTGTSKILRVVGYTNGYFGYLPDRTSLLRTTYEARCAMFDLASLRAVEDQLRALSHDDHLEESS